jgi:hypothetical protein
LIEDLHDLPISALQLIIGAQLRRRKTLLEILKSIPKLPHMSTIVKFERLFVNRLEVKNCNDVDFWHLPIDEIVGAHIDEGTYYLTRDRYHLSISGRYQYFLWN